MCGLHNVGIGQMNWVLTTGKEILWHSPAPQTDSKGNPSGHYLLRIP